MQPACNLVLPRSRASISRSPPPPPPKQAATASCVGVCPLGSLFVSADDLPKGSSVVDAHAHAEAAARHRLPVPSVPRVGLMDRDELDGGERHESIPDRRRLQ